MTIVLDYCGGATRLTLADSLGDAEGGVVRPRKLRKALKRLRTALGLAEEARLEVVAFGPADGLMVVPTGSPWASPEPPEPGMIPPEEVLGRWPLSPAALEVGHTIHYGLATATPPIRTYGDLASFIRTFTESPRSAIRGKPTVKDLVNHLNSNSYQAVSAAIHKIGPSLSMKVVAFVDDFLERAPATIIPPESTP